jgi:transcriptional regulator GlxA family with amidase domain
MYVQKPVVVDDHIVTAEGPSAMLDFMVELLDQMGVEWYTI